MAKGNKKKEAFLANIPNVSLNNQTNDLAERCKFNFSYFVNNDPAGQDFKEWDQNELVKLLEKLKEYSKFPLSHWKTQTVGNYSVLVNYGAFPKEKSDFKEPKHIPLEIEWCRFHLENKPRLIGFVVPERYHKKEQRKDGFLFDKNTFYIVFLDKKHLFYKTKT